MKLVLLSYSICEVFTLAEALNWIAFKAPPIMDRADIFDAFEYPRSIFPYEAYPFPIGQQVSLNAATDLAGPQYPDCPSPQLFELRKDDPLFQKDEFLAYKQACSDAYTQYERDEKAWNDARAEAMEPAQAALFLALKEGRLKARGELSYVLKTGFGKHAWANDGEEQWEECVPSQDGKCNTVDVQIPEKSENELEAFKKIFSDNSEYGSKAMERYENIIQDIGASS